MKELFSIIMILLVLCICSCDSESSEETGKILIREKLDELELAFNLHHIDEIMEHYDLDYLHDGDNFDDVQLDWEIRLNDYFEMELSEIEVEVDVDEATVSMRRSFWRGGDIEVLTEPEDSGDISYWEYGIDGWKISGNGKIR